MLPKLRQHNKHNLYHIHFIFMFFININLSILTWQIKKHTGRKINHVGFHINYPTVFIDD